MLVPSFFGDVVVHPLDTSFMDILNKGGALAFLVYIYVTYRVILINRMLGVLVIGFLLLSLVENILNQYSILMPLIFLFYFRETNRISVNKEIQ